MDDSEHEQGSHGVIQDLPIRAVQLGDSHQGEAKRHALDEVVVSAGVEEQGVRLVVRSRFRGVDISVAYVLLRLDSTIHDAIG